MVCKVCNYYIPDGAIRCAHCGAYREKWRNRFTWTNLGILVNIAVLIFIGIQSFSIKTQTKILKDSHEAEHRPYLYLHLVDTKIWHNKVRKAWFGGGYLRFINIGKVPANIINTEYMVASNISGVIKNREWFEKDSGGYPDINVVMPNQEDVQVPCGPMISGSDVKPKLLYIGATITYRGYDPDKIYWFKYSQLFVIPFTKLLLKPLKHDHEWDQNENINPPILKEPDWEEYLSRNYIKTLTKID